MSMIFSSMIFLLLKFPIIGYVDSSSYHLELQRCDKTLSLLHKYKSRYERRSSTRNKKKQIPIAVGNGQLKTMHSNGKRQSSLRFKKGLCDGFQQEWYDNGQIRFKLNFRQGLYTGKQEGWYKNGKKWFTFHYIKQVNVKRILKKGIHFYLNELKLIQEKGRSVNHHNQINHRRAPFMSSFHPRLNGLQIQWSKSGQKMYEERYKRGKKDGVQRYWAANRILLKKENYKNGEKQGLQSYWDNYGRLSKKQVYSQGKMIEQEIYHIDGYMTEKMKVDPKNLLREKKTYSSKGKMIRHMVSYNQKEIRIEHTPIVIYESVSDWNTNIHSKVALDKSGVLLQARNLPLEQLSDGKKVPLRSNHEQVVSIFRGLESYGNSVVKKYPFNGVSFGTRKRSLLVSYYADGQIHRVAHPQLNIEFYNNGHKKSERGPRRARSWYANGQILEDKIYKSQSTIKTRWYMNGQKELYQEKKGRDVKVLKWSPKGVLLENTFE